MLCQRLFVVFLLLLSFDSFAAVVICKVERSKEVWINIKRMALHKVAEFLVSFASSFGIMWNVPMWNGNLWRAIKKRHTRTHTRRKIQYSYSALALHTHFTRKKRGKKTTRSSRKILKYIRCALFAMPTAKKKGFSLSC